MWESKMVVKCVGVHVSCHSRTARFWVSFAKPFLGIAVLLATRRCETSLPFFPHLFFLFENLSPRLCFSYYFMSFYRGLNANCFQGLYGCNGVFAWFRLFTTSDLYFKSPLTILQTIPWCFTHLNFKCL